MKRATQFILLLVVFIGWISISFAESETDGARELASKNSKRSAQGIHAQKAVVQKKVAKTKSHSENLKKVKSQKKMEVPTLPPQELTISNIEIRGVKKVESDAVAIRLISKVGALFSPEIVRKDIEAIFKSGYFYDVRVESEVSDSQVKLIYSLVEKPSIVEIVFRGNSDIETGDLQESANLKIYEILNMAKVQESAESLRKYYEDKGYFLARVTPRVENVTEGESVRVVFDVEENEKVKVKKITFLGNLHVPDGKLKGVMQTQEGGFFSFLSSTGAYKQDAFDRDIQLLNYIYLNEGYVHARIDRPQVYVTPDKKGIYITIRVDEGDRFKIGNIDFSGDLLFDRQELDASVMTKSSEWYAHETLLKDLRSLQAKYGDLGYAYANIVPRTRFQDADRTVDINFEIDKGEKVYFGRINVVGNTKTRDKVIRRELQIHEGELYNETRKRESMDNVKRLGFFEVVEFNAKTPENRSDLMDLDIVVKERNTGNLQIGAGYSSQSHFVFNGQINQTNLFGRGQNLGVSVDMSSNQTNFKLNFTEPYLYDSKWLLGVEGFHSESKSDQYSDLRKGGSLRVGHPLAPYLHGSLKYKLDETLISLDSQRGDPDLFPTDTANGTTSSLTGILSYDKRDDRFSPSKGVATSFSLEYAGLGGKKKYTKGFANFQYFKKLFWEVVWRNNLSYGFLHSNDPNQEIPYNVLYLLGGPNSLRGYDYGTIGRKKLSNKLKECYMGLRPGDTSCPVVSGGPLSEEDATEKAKVPFGGKQELVYQIELEFPVISEAGIKGVLFYDVGEAEDDFVDGEIRHDVGFGFRWFSPLGPLRFEWGFPIGRRNGERAVNFEFAIGAPF